MRLDPPDLELFFRLHRTFMFFVNQRLHAIPQQPANPGQYSSLPPTVRAQVHDAWLARTDLIETFVDENPAGLPVSELAIIHSWQHFVCDRFFVVRKSQKHTVFVSASDPPVA